MPTTSQQPHPLSPYAGRIDPNADYTVRDIADLMEMHTSGVSGMAAHGWFPGATMGSNAHGGRMQTWSGRLLREIARQQLRIVFDHGTFQPSTLYRVGCRCPVCTAAHTAHDRARKRALSDDRFTAAQRARVLELVGSGATVADAADEVDVSVHQIYGRANFDAVFDRALDDAAWSLCVFGAGHPQCGTASGYAGNERSLSNPRPRCRGTGCRLGRREASRRERSLD
jgi:hypothetical protein